MMGLPECWRSGNTLSMLSGPQWAFMRPRGRPADVIFGLRTFLPAFTMSLVNNRLLLQEISRFSTLAY